MTPPRWDARTQSDPEGRTTGEESTVAAMNRAYDSAIDDAVHVEKVRVAGVPIEFRFASGSLLPRLWPALSHHRPAEEDARITIHLWAADEAGVPLVRYSDEALEGGVTASGRVGPAPRVRVRYHPDLRALVAYDRDSGRCWYEAASAAALPWWESGAPLRSLLAWIMADHGRALVHGAAVTTPRGAVLLVGRGGAGKSTTALTAMEGGLGYLGDDYCVLEPGPTPRVHSLYSTAKITPSVLSDHPDLVAHVLNPDRDADDKALVLIDHARPGALRRDAPLIAIAAPEIRDLQDASIEPISSSAALTALAASTILQLPGAGQEQLRVLADLVRGVPRSRLVLGRDRTSIVRCLRALAGGDEATMHPTLTHGESRS